jgi:hypothetical protein
LIPAALHAGFRHIDTAHIYRNEGEIGQCVAAFGIRRSEIFLTTKVWVSNYPESRLKAAFGFLGITDLSFIRAEGVAMGPEERSGGHRLGEARDRWARCVGQLRPNKLQTGEQPCRIRKSSSPSAAQPVSKAAPLCARCRRAVNSKCAR